MSLREQLQERDIQLDLSHITVIAMHTNELIIHLHVFNFIMFQGWKKENVAVRGANHRIIYIDNSDPPYCLKKVEALKVILDRELGFVPESSMLNSSRRVG